jgi:hypothetical protein
MMCWLGYIKAAIETNQRVSSIYTGDPLTPMMQFYDTTAGAVGGRNLFAQSKNIEYQEKKIEKEKKMEKKAKKKQDFFSENF